METKMNIGLKLSRNFQTVTCEVVDHKIEHENDEELKAKIRRTFKMVEAEIEEEFTRLQSN